MIKLFKHNYFKYLLLVILSLKVVFFVTENINSINETEISYLLDTGDFENESEDQKEFDESEQINQNSQISYHFNQNKDLNNQVLIFKEYRVQYLEFITPPPKFI